jgi:hypothetical protein
VSRCIKRGEKPRRIARIQSLHPPVLPLPQRLLYTIRVSRSHQSLTPNTAFPYHFIMLCKVCVEGLQGIWDPFKTKRVCRVDEFDKDEVPLEDSKFVTVETYKTVKPYDPELRRPEHWMFGHHLTQESFEQSVRDGCVMCDAFKPWHAGQQQVKSDPKIAALGYYSLFSIGFEDCPIMYMYVSDSRGGFALTPHIGESDAYPISWDLDFF